MQLALTQELEPKDGTPARARNPTVRAKGVVVAFRSQIISFLLATLVGVGFGIWRVENPEPPKQRLDRPRRCAGDPSTKAIPSVSFSSIG